MGNFLLVLGLVIDPLSCPRPPMQVNSHCFVACFFNLKTRKKRCNLLCFALLCPSMEAPAHPPVHVSCVVLLDLKLV
jgi:hypothetical protein